MPKPNNPDMVVKEKQSDGNHHFLLLEINLIRKLGLDAAVLLADLLVKERYFEDHNMLDERGFFYNSEDHREMNTGLSPYRQQRAIDILEDSNILYKVERRGIPSRQRFKINHSLLKNLSETSQDFANYIKIINNRLLVLDSTLSKDNVKASEKEAVNEFICRFQRLAPISTPEIEISPKDFIRQGTGEYAVLLSWNKLPRPAIEHIKLNSKLIGKAVEWMKEMRNGVFGRQNRRRWDEKWLDKHGIDQKEFENKKWTIREICKVIEGPLANMYKDGYWPARKSGLPHTLTDALYNPFSRTSFFMLAYYDPPGILAIDLKDRDPFPKVTELLEKEKILKRDEMKAGDWKMFFEGVRELKKYLKEIDWDNYGARQMFPSSEDGDPHSLITQYVDWMKGRNSDLLMPSRIPERWHVKMIRPDFWMWRKFMEVVNRYWGQVFKSVETEKN